MRRCGILSTTGKGDVLRVKVTYSKDVVRIHLAFRSARMPIMPIFAIINTCPTAVRARTSPTAQCTLSPLTSQPWVPRRTVTCAAKWFSRASVATVNAYINGARGKYTVDERGFFLGEATQISLARHPASLHPQTESVSVVRLVDTCTPCKSCGEERSPRSWSRRSDNASLTTSPSSDFFTASSFSARNILRGRTQFSLSTLCHVCLLPFSCGCSTCTSPVEGIGATRR